VEYAEALGEAYLAFVKHDQRKSGGHYLTPASIAKFMAEGASYSQPYLRVLDPGSGTGVLSAAVCEAVCNKGTVRNLHVEACESHPLLANLTRLVLTFSRQWLDHRGIELTFDVRQGDFVMEYSGALEATAKTVGHVQGAGGTSPEYDLVISNPPYFKIGKDDPRAVAGASVVYGQPNIYSMFMAISAELLAESGRLVYIVPRSFASGPYFKRFREVFFQKVAPTAIHLFDSRKEVFRSQTVLQENLVLTARARKEGEDQDDQVLVSHSKGVHDIAERQQLSVEMKSVLDMESVNKELCIPVCAEDLELVKAVREWPNTLGSLGLDISTGPVVPFRARRFLADCASEAPAVPLLWMHHVRPMRVEWPSTGGGKAQWVKVVPESVKLLVKDDTYVLLRRFSAKEEKRRLVAAPLFQGFLNVDMVGLENHLNYIRGVSRKLDEELTYGLAALLNSIFLDRYFRVSNGNTQVSATELRAMPLPSEEDIRVIGSGVASSLDPRAALPEFDAFIARTLNLSSKLWAGR
jgi:adenine-specific DNA-methyltransferase